MNDANAHKPGYKHTPLGWVPEEWEVKELQEVTQKTIVYGIVQAGPEIDDGVPYIKSTDVGREININGLSRTSLEIAQKYKRSEVNPGDIVFSLRGNIGAVSIVPSSLRRANLTQGTARISIKEAYDNKFIKLALNSPFVIRDIIVRAKGSTFMEISLEELRKVPVPIPPLPEQNQIATILSTWDTAIAKTQEIIRQLQERNRGLMQELLRPKEGWKECKIGELIKEVKRPVNWDDNDLYHLISVRRRSGGAFFRESLYGHQILTKQLFTAEENDFLISKMQIVHGASALVTAPLADMKISGSYIAVRSRDDQKLDIRYFNWISKTPWFYRLTYISSYGVHIEKMTFDFEDFKRHKILLPATLWEQKDIVEVLEAATTEVAFYENYLTTLQTQKKGLMQKLLTGAIRISPNLSPS